MRICVPKSIFSPFMSHAASALPCCVSGSKSKPELVFYFIAWQHSTFLCVHVQREIQVWDCSFVKESFQEYDLKGLYIKPLGRNINKRTTFTSGALKHKTPQSFTLWQCSIQQHKDTHQSREMKRDEFDPTISKKKAVIFSKQSNSFPTKGSRFLLI